MGVGIDADAAAGLDGKTQQTLGWVEALRPGIDLDGHTEPLAGGEHVDVGVSDRPHHPGGHLGGRHPQLRVHGGDDHIELGKQLRILVQRAVFEDVDFDPGQQPKR